MTVEGPVLITGGAGFIGSALVRQLAAGGLDVVAVDNLANGKARNLDDVPGGYVRLEVADIRDTERMAPLIAGSRTVFHLACLGVRHSIHAPVENHRVNAEATLGLLELARHWGRPRFVHVSSSEVYGTAKRVPMDEDHPTLPHTVYGASKLAGECYARAYHDTYGMATTVVRPFNAFGPRCHHEGDSGEVIPKFLLRAMAGRPLIVFGDGSQTRDFTYVEDTARGIAAAARPAAIGRTVNLGSGAEISIRELAELVSAVAGRNTSTVETAAARPGDVMRLYADVTAARSLLEFQPRVSLRDGLEQLRDWYAAQPESVADRLRDEVVVNWAVGNAAP